MITRNGSDEIRLVFLTRVIIHKSSAVVISLLKCCLLSHWFSRCGRLHVRYRSKLTGQQRAAVVRRAVKTLFRSFFAFPHIFFVTFSNLDTLKNWMLCNWPNRDFIRCAIRFHRHSSLCGPNRYWFFWEPEQCTRDWLSAVHAATFLFCLSRCTFPPPLILISLCVCVCSHFAQLAICRSRK